jgi:hypothetical protein
VLVVVLENPDRFAIKLTEQISSIGLFAVTESQRTEDEHDDEDDSKFRNLGLILLNGVLLLERWLWNWLVDLNSRRQQSSGVLSAQGFID